MRSIGMKARRATVFAAAACLIMSLVGGARAADILLVGGQLDSSDRELVTLLKSFGHTVVNEASYATAGFQFFNGAPSPAQLTGVDLILFSRAANSGDYDDGTEPAQWNALTTPLVMLNSAFVRGNQATLANNRWGWMDGTTVVSGAPSPTNFDPYPDPNHPFVVGRTTSVFPPNQTMDYIESTAIASGANMVATLTIPLAAGGTFVTPGIVDMPAGTLLFTDAQGTASTLGARRVFMQVYEYPDTTDVFALSTNGGQILNQIINTLTSNAPSSPRGDVNGDGLVNITDFNAIRNNFRTSVTNRTLGDLTGDGFVDLADFRQWKDASTGAAAAVPEPAGIALAVVATGGCALVRRRRRS